MSFSNKVKEEALSVMPVEKHCRTAEISALVRFNSKPLKEGDDRLLLLKDNEAAYRKCFTLLSKTFNIDTDVLEHSVLKKLSVDNPTEILSRDCCKRAYLRGAFLASGFMADPNKRYHFEILSPNEETSDLLISLFSDFDVKARKSYRKKYSVVYLKESEAISDALNIIGVHRAMMELVGARIVKDVRNDINRRNNCDTANIFKSVSAASRQTEDILFIRQTEGFDNLPGTLREIAIARLEHPESSLTELGGFLDPPVGKSGVNHRLRKLSEYAEGLRSKGRSYD